MTRQRLHALFTDRFGLVSEPVPHGDSRTCFLYRIQRHPAHSTRTVRAFYAPDGEPSHLQLCAFSDNNNNVLLRQPFIESELLAALRREVALVEQRIGTNPSGD